MEAPGQLPGSGTNLALGELNLELSGHSLNGGTWSITRKMNQSRTGGLGLGLRAILQENGGAWSITKYWPWFKLCSLWLRHLVSYQDITISPRPGLGMWDTPTLDLRALWSSPRIRYPWLRHLSTRSWCHTDCEIEALIILSIYDDVLWVGMKDPYDHLFWPQGT